ncbi:PREDICTED: probable pectate lyase 12 isoform X1 [Camelina sativa]|uniref:Pectate lyase n=2 Tax=Camelina sativa TaxID=90675 RepID=A0ABM1RMR8_CAMSA|nr:PREDICTED: probable pectate lyase 12 isoform X4 [Camelina sativa]XP_019100306.1 PREDICTED: probable pectate lyase 12 isoform X1 [Camelina sativa]
MLPRSCIVLSFSLFLFLPQMGFAMLNNRTVLLTPHPDPELVAYEVQWRVNASITRRQALDTTDQAGSDPCFTGNPIDDCWKCNPNWPNNRQGLADCGIGFGQYALGGKGGQFYFVTDSSDDDAVNPRPGTLRYGVIQEEPLWIVFPSNMMIKLKQELIFNSYKTLDGRGANVHIVGGGCITLQYVSNIIIHNIHIHHCYQSGNTNVRSSPTHYGFRSKSDGDGISVFGSKDIWIDHCSLSRCKDGLIDAVMGSTGITISNNFFSHHNEVMLLGHSDHYEPDSGMQVTIAFNHFGEKLIQRMPRCRRGYIHVVNNDFTQWEMYAIGGSGNPTINSQGNRYTAPTNPFAKEVTKRVETPDGDWKGWNWRSEGDILVNGAFFVASGEGAEMRYEKAYSVEPKSASFITQITFHSGVLGVGGRNNNLGMWTTTGSEGNGGLDSYNDYTDEMSGAGSTIRLSFSVLVLSFLLSSISYLVMFTSTQMFML